MIIILKRNANKEKVENLKTELVNQGFKLHLSEGTEASLIGLIGDTSRIHEDWLKANDVVDDVRRIREPYKKANRSMHPDDTVIDVCGRGCRGRKAFRCSLPPRRCFQTENFPVRVPGSSRAGS